ncbi:hypothetical protein AB1484_38660 [Parafrankia sp. FMc6]|uniref:hypothetical protein n=1 Tax=Parafrankia soli TaxID=2599596 RepID=UPI0034D72447
MTEPTKAGGHKTLAVKLPPDLHAQLELVSGLDGLSMGTASVGVKSTETVDRWSIGSELAG